MKTFKLLAFGIMLIIAGSVQGQLSVNVHIGSPPSWGPSGYNDVRYYYLPDIETYYDVQTSMFIYISGNRWVHRSYLPARYRNYDLNDGYKVVMNDYRGNSPYSHFNEHRMKYAKGYRGGEQHNIGERNNNHERQREEFRPNRNDNRSNDGNHFRNNNQNEQRNKGQGRGNDRKQERGNDKKDGRD